MAFTINIRIVFIQLLIFWRLSLCDENEKIRRYILEAQCEARCLQLYGDEVSISKNRLYSKDIYAARKCVNNTCKQCKLPCSYIMRHRDGCRADCKTSICNRSCDFTMKIKVSSGNNNGTEAESAVLQNTKVSMAHTITTDPVDTCMYRHRINNNKTRITIHLKWRVTDSYWSKKQLIFVISMRSRNNLRSRLPWKTLGKTHYSYNPMRGLDLNTEHQFKLTVVSEEGVIGTPQYTEWIRTLSDNYTISPPTNASVVTQTYYKRGISALLYWTNGKVAPCFYKIFWMPLCKDQSGDFQEEELKAPPVTKYWMNRLQFGCNYEVNIYSYETSAFNKGSTSTKIVFQTMDCLTITGYNYSLCAPEAPWNLTAMTSKSRRTDGIGNITLAWTHPKNATKMNAISNYSIVWSKEIPLQFAQDHIPDKGNATVSGNTSMFVIPGLHWNSVYRIDLRATSTGGTSRPKIFYVDFSSDDNSNTIYNTTALLVDTNPDHTMVFGVVIAVALTAIIIITTTLSVTRMKRKALKGRLPMQETNPIYSTPDHTNGCTQPLLYDDYEVEFHCLTFLEIIGEGAFGKVAKAELTPSKYDGKEATKTIVAVKMLKDYADMNEKRSLMTEIESMKQLGHHPNIVSMIGCCTKGPKICLIMDCCALGDLRQYLLKLRPQAMYESLNRRRSKDSGISEKDCLLNDANQPITQAQLLSYARQITIGMEYLAEKKFIHRDLAARNILMSDTDRLKISDFGLTRDVYETNMYQPTSARKLPYKWMALEAIYDQTFTTKSDVWSFGIVLWEIVTLGGCPYPGIPNEDLFRLLKDGYRMENPGNCSPEIYQIMLSCWHPSPLSRPSFKELREKLESMLEMTKPYINLTVTVSEDYYKEEKSGDKKNDELADTVVDVSYIDVEPYQQQASTRKLKHGYQKIYIEGPNSSHDLCDPMCRLCTMRVTPSPVKKTVLSASYEEPNVDKSDTNTLGRDTEPDRDICLLR